jgi:hypothetical protein
MVHQYVVRKGVSPVLIAVGTVMLAGGMKLAPWLTKKDGAPKLSAVHWNTRGVAEKMIPAQYWPGDAA